MQNRPTIDQIRVSVARHRAGRLTSARRQRLFRPYGVWTCEDGRQVLFNRYYEPLFSRYPDQAAVAADPHEWVENIIAETWFYRDGDLDHLTASQKALDDWGISLQRNSLIRK